MRAGCASTIRWSQKIEAQHPHVIGSVGVASRHQIVNDVTLAEGDFDMFVQVIQGRIYDSGRVRAQLDKWVKEVAPGAVGWLGTTSGVTDDGQADRAGALRIRGSGTAEQRPSGAVGVVGGDGDAVQRRAGVPQQHLGRGRHPRGPVAGRLRPGHAGPFEGPGPRTRTDGQRPDRLAGFRPDILGTVSIAHDGDAWTMAIYFTSEAAAREGEQKEPPPEMQQMMKEMDELSIGEPVFFDLKDPWLDAPS